MDLLQKSLQRLELLCHLTIEERAACSTASSQHNNRIRIIVPLLFWSYLYRPKRRSLLHYLWREQAVWRVAGTSSP